LDKRTASPPCHCDTPSGGEARLRPAGNLVARLRLSVRPGVSVPENGRTPSASAFGNEVVLCMSVRSGVPAPVSGRTGIFVIIGLNKLPVLNLFRGRIFFR